MSALIFASTVTALPLLQYTDASAINTSTGPTTSDSIGTNTVGAIEWQIQSILYYKAISNCIKYNQLHVKKPSEATGGQWLNNDNTQAIGVYMKDTSIDSNSTIKNTQDWDGMVKCDNAQLILGALSLWNLSADDVLCNTGFIRDTITPDQTPTQCEQYTSYSLIAKDSSRSSGDWAHSFSTYIAKIIYGGSDPKIETRAEWYIFYRHTLNESCIPGIDSTSGSILKSDNRLNYAPANHDGVVWVDNTTGDSTVTSFGGVLYSDNKTNLGPIQPGFLGSNVMNSSTCKDIVLTMNNFAGDYSDVVKATLTAGATNSSTVPGGVVNDQQTPPPTTSCAIGGIGWIVCPVLSFMGNLADGMYGIFTSFLVTSPSILSTGSDSSPSNTTYNVWQTMRTIANIAFVIAFLIIIFSQITGVLIDNYGIKKMFPKLIIAAILVNVSFFICQVAVDLSNIIGYSLQDFFAGIQKTISTAANPAGAWSGGTWTSIIGVGGLIVVGSIAVMAGALAFVIPAVIGVLVALLMILVILIGRQALIILLVIVSPLAFVAFLFPGTDKLFKKWGKTLVSMLLLFPIVALIYGVSKLASVILLPVFTTNTTGFVKIIGQIAANLITVLPLFLVPSILKGALNGIGNIGSTINQLGSKAGSALGKQGGKVYGNSRLAQLTKYQADKRASDRSLVQSGAYAGGNIYKRGKSGLNKAFNNSPLSRKFGDRSAAAGITAASKIEEGQIAEAATLYKAQKGPEVAPAQVAADYEEAVRGGDNVKAMALQSILRGSGTPGLNELHNSIEKLENDGHFTKNAKAQDLRRSVKRDILNAGLKGKDAGLNAWSYSSGTKVVEINGKKVEVEQTLANLSHGALSNEIFSKLTDTELSGQNNEVLNNATNAAKATKLGGNFTIRSEVADSILKNPTTSTNLGRSGTLEIFEARRSPAPATPQNDNDNTNGGGI